jgi:DNA-binding response OmpR family regulator
MSGRGTIGVLVVDADPRERGRLQRELEARGWRVWVAADADAAARVYAERRDEVRAAVVDLQLPGLQGGRVLAELEHQTPAVACVAMSAGLAPYAAAAFRRITPTPLFAKPVSTSELDAVLRHSAGETG